MFIEPTTEENIKARFTVLLKRMEETYPQYAELKGGKKYKTTLLYKTVWKYFNTLITKWE